MLREPPVAFTPWPPWAERSQVKNAHLPGVYLLGKWEGTPPSHVDPLSHDVVYIGAVAEGSLMGRWQQFHRAAFEGKPGHTGGLAYREAFGDEGEDLHVSAFAPEGLSREMRTVFILYLERRLMWDWARKWEGLPICNSR